MISELERSVKQKGIPVMIKLGQCLKKKNLNSSLSFGQAALTFCLPSATSFPTLVMI